MSKTPAVAIQRVSRGINEVEEAIDQLLKMGSNLLGEMVDAHEVLDLSFDKGQLAFARVTELLAGLGTIRQQAVQAHGVLHKVVKEVRSDIVLPSERFEFETDAASDKIAA